MKKLLLFLVFNYLLICPSFSQTYPRAPKSELIKQKNSFMTLNPEIPLFLNTIRDANIKYCWYDTKSVFGERVRTSEEPCKVIECTYTAGRLYMVKEGQSFYQYSWSNEGEIIRITEYNHKGETIDERTWSDTGLKYLESPKTMTEGKKTKTVQSGIFLDSIIFASFWSEIHFSSNKCIEERWEFPEKHIIFGFTKYEDARLDDENTLFYFYPDGRVQHVYDRTKGEIFNFHDDVGCAYFEY